MTVLDPDLDIGSLPLLRSFGWPHQGFGLEGDVVDLTLNPWTMHISQDLEKPAAHMVEDVVLMFPNY